MIIVIVIGYRPGAAPSQGPMGQAPLGGPPAAPLIMYYEYVYIYIYIYIYVYIYIYTFNVSCFRAGGVHIVQTSVDRIPRTRSRVGPGVRDQFPRQ